MPPVNQTRRHLETASDFGHRRAGSKCRRHNLPTFLVTGDDEVPVPSAM
jgi:hypothetical protein